MARSVRMLLSGSSLLKCRLYSGSVRTMARDQRISSVDIVRVMYYRIMFFELVWVLPESGGVEVNTVWSSTLVAIIDGTLCPVLGVSLECHRHNPAFAGLPGMHSALIVR